MYLWTGQNINLQRKEINFIKDSIWKIKAECIKTTPPPRGVPHACFPGLSEAQPLSNFILPRLKGDVASSTLAEGGSGAAATAWGAQEGRDSEAAGLPPPGKSEAASAACCRPSSGPRSGLGSVLTRLQSTASYSPGAGKRQPGGDGPFPAVALGVVCPPTC